MPDWRTLVGFLSIFFFFLLPSALSSISVVYSQGLELCFFSVTPNHTRIVCFFTWMPVHKLLIESFCSFHLTLQKRNFVFLLQSILLTKRSLLWLGCGLFPKDSCTRNLVPNVLVLKKNGTYKKCGLMIGDEFMTMLVQGLMLVSKSGVGLPGLK